MIELYANELIYEVYRLLHFDQIVINDDMLIICN